MPDPSDHGFPGYGQESGPDPRAGLGAVPVLVRPDGVLLPGVDEEAGWSAGGGDELRWSFGCDLAEALAGLDLPLAGPGGGDQDQLLAELDALDATAADPDHRLASPGTGGAGRDLGLGDASGQGSSDPRGDPAADGAAALGPGVLGLVADALPGPGLAAWVAQCPPGQLSDVDLPAVAAALRRVTSWAQATELAVVAQLAARSAARDPRTGLAEDGRPAAVTRDAAAQAGLALTLSPGAASWWADLAVTLGWRLPATGAALLAGDIDLARARIIAEATAVLTDDLARAVEDQVLPAAGGQTYGQLRAAVARAVILADPKGAEERREATERRARVGLYPAEHHTATLTGMNLPAVHAAAAMARLTALARAMQAAGAGGGIDLLRSHAYLGLLLDTLPYIPPRPDAPPDNDPGPDDPGPGPDDPGPGPGGPGPGGGDSGGPGLSGPDHRDPGDGGLGDDEPGDDGPAGPDDAAQPGAAPRRGTRRRGTGDPGTPPRPGTSRTGRRRGPSGQPTPDSTPDDSATGDPPPAGPASPSDPGPGQSRPPAARPDSTGTSPGGPAGPPGRPRPPDRSDPSSRHPGGPSPGPPGDPPGRPDPPGPPPPGSAPGTGPPPGPGQSQAPGPGDPGGAGPAEARSDRLPSEGWPTDADAPADDGVRKPSLEVPEGYADDGGYPDYDLYDEPADPNPIPAWPPVPATTPALGPTLTASPGPPGPAAEPDDNAGRPAPGLLELTMPWSALAHRSASPATLSRIGPITAEQARLLAAVAATTPATRWRVILTDPHGHALAVTTIPRHATRPRHHNQPRHHTQPRPATALTGRITITMPITALDALPPPDGHPLLSAIATAAARALARLQHDLQSTEPEPSDPASGQPGPSDLGASPAGPGEPSIGTTGGCAHHAATAGYRPTTAIRDYVTARDQTCRYPCCRQPAWHADLDHTHPWHKGGPTCPCNLGALCRTHHILKQLQGWTLTQPRPGVFHWTTPTGRTYTCEPDIHPS